MLFGIYIAGLESFLGEHIQDGVGCLVHHALIFILSFANDVIIMAFTREGLPR
jgi:hypothetical protein